MAQQQGQDDRQQHPAQRLAGMLGIIGGEDQKNHVNQENVNGRAEATAGQRAGG
ncbi:MAG TPA: hypothetical protein VFR42_03140 [Candidatus Acidoferrum sp.]|nr:hypothetical protein [Candidatus Acidoferrum sp.]